MKIYLCGKWADGLEIGERMRYLESLGHQITHDWTNCDEWPSYKCAKADLRGVKEADVVIVFMTDPKYAYRGSFTELGAALALDKKVFVVAPTEQTDAYYLSNCFFHHPSIYHFSSWEALFDPKGKFIPEDCCHETIDLRKIGADLSSLHYE